MAALKAGIEFAVSVRAESTWCMQEVTGQTQSIAVGPVASQLAIKMLGTNGGGFFNANSAHPYENPTPFSNFIQMLLILVIPAGFTYTLGRMRSPTSFSASQPGRVGRYCGEVRSSIAFFAR